MSDKDEDKLEKTTQDINIVITTDDDSDEDEYEGGTSRLLKGVLFLVFLFLLVFVTVGALIKYNVIDVDVAKGYIHKISDKITGNAVDSLKNVKNETEDLSVPVIELTESESYTNSNELIGLSFTYTLDSKTDEYTINVSKDFDVKDTFPYNNSMKDNKSMLVYSKDMSLIFAVFYNESSATYTVSDIHKLNEFTENNKTKSIKIGDHNISKIINDRNDITVNAFIGSDLEETKGIKPIKDKYTCEDFSLYASDNNAIIKLTYNKTAHEYAYSLDETFLKSSVSTDSVSGIANNIYFCVFSSDSLTINDSVYEQSINIDDSLLCYYNYDLTQWALAPLTNIPTVNIAESTIDTANALYIEGLNGYVALYVDSNNKSHLAVYDSIGTLTTVLDATSFVTKTNKDELEAYNAYLDAFEASTSTLLNLEWGDLSYSSLEYKATDNYAKVIGTKSTKKTLTIPSKVLGVSVCEIAKDAFSKNKDITSVTIEGLSYIKGGAFNECSSLSVVIIGEGLLGIEPNTFTDCASLTITIPDSVYYISQSAFNLNDVTIICNAGSYAEQFAIAHNIRYVANALNDNSSESLKPEPSVSINLEEATDSSSTPTNESNDNTAEAIE